MRFLKSGVSRVFVLSAFCIFIILTGCKKDEEVPLKSSLRGNAKDEFGGPLDSVRCIIKSSSFETFATTDTNGNFRFDGIVVGQYTITASRKDYNGVTEQVQVNPEGTAVELILTSGNSFLRVADSTVYIFHSGGSKEIDIESNASWTASSADSWLSVSPLSKSGNAKLKLTSGEFAGDNLRSTKITIRVGSLERIVNVIQYPPIKLLKSERIFGNDELGIDDSISLTFNQPITVKSIRGDNEMCVLKQRTIGNKVSFNYPCAKLAEQYGFMISVEDAQKQTFNFQTTVPFYDKKLTVSGFILDYFISDDSKTIWAITNFPDRVVQISMENLSIVKSYDLDFKPEKIKFNKYYNVINLFSHSNWCYTCDSNYILMFDPNSGQISRVEVNAVDGYDHPNYPSIFPVNLSTMKNGLGVLLGTDDSGNRKWRFVDGAKNNSMYISSTHSSTWYRDIELNYDQSEIYMLHPGTMLVDVLKIGSPDILTYSPPRLEGNGRISASQKADRVLHSLITYQYVTDLKGYRSWVTSLDPLPFYGGTAFSNRAGEEEVIYYLADGSLMILDYKVGFTSVSMDANGSLTRIQASLDGSQLAAFRVANSGQIQNRLRSTSIVYRQTRVFMLGLVGGRVTIRQKRVLMYG